MRPISSCSIRNEYATRIADEIRQNLTSVKDPANVLEDLENMAKLLTQAKEHGLKWHLQVDF